MEPVEDEPPSRRHRLWWLVVVGMAVILAAVVVYLFAGGGAPKMVISGFPFDWGRVAIGQSKRMPVVISNGGNKDLLITSAEIAGAGFAPETPVDRVPAGESRESMLAFSPTAPGPVSGTLTLMSNDPDQPTIRLELRGFGLDLKQMVQEIFAPIDSKTPPSSPQ
jgi:hypothetical protein